MVDFYLKCRSVSEVMRFYLTQNTVSGSTAAAVTDGAAMHGPYKDADLFNLVGSFSLEFRSRLMEEWREVLEKNRGTGVILLLGAAGGFIVYMIRRRNGGQRRSRDQARNGAKISGGGERGRNSGEYSGKRRPRYAQRGSLWSWLFEEEVVEDLSRDSYLLRSHYFGPASSGCVSLGAPGNDWSHLGLGSSQQNLSLNSDPGDYDVSLNSFTCDTTPRKLLKGPLLFDIRRNGQSRRGQLSASSGSRQQSRQAGLHLQQQQAPVSRCNPCPRCVKGTCRIKRHQVYLQQKQDDSSGSSSALSTSPINQFDRKYMKTSTPDFYGIDHCGEKVVDCPPRDLCRLDGDGSDETEDPSLHLTEDLARYSATPLGVKDRQYRPSRYMFTGGSGKRGAPDGKERVSTTPSPPLSQQHHVNSDCSPLHPPSSSTSSGAPQTTPERLLTRDDFSAESDLEHMSGPDSVTGSMLDLVHDAREIRRLIREVSIDSNASDLSLGLYLPPDDQSPESVHQIESITRGLDELIFNCANLDGDMLEDHTDHKAMASSKSSTSGLYQYAGVDEEHVQQSAEDSSLKRDGSIPDLRNLQTTLKKSAKGLWKLTNITGLSEGSRQASILSDSGGSMEWESPLHAAAVGLPPDHPGSSYHHRGGSRFRYRTPVLSSNVSECSMDDLSSLAGSCLDQWEWDDAAYYISGADEDDDERIVLDGHSTWLPDIGSAELDLEAELKLRDASLGPCNSSARSSLEPELARLPPSGRSSAERFSSRRLSASSRGSSISDDVTLMSCSHNKLNTNRMSRSRSRDRKLSDCYLDRDRKLSDCYLDRDRKLSDYCSDLDSSTDSSVVPPHLQHHHHQHHPNQHNFSYSHHGHHSLSSTETSGISSMNSSMMSSSTGSSILVSSINLSPVKEAPQEITTSPTPQLLPPSPVSPRSPHSSPSSPISLSSSPQCDKMEIAIGNIRTTDTVIKVQLPDNKQRPDCSSRSGDTSSGRGTASEARSKASVALFTEETK